jgi:hypothetical protein
MPNCYPHTEILHVYCCMLTLITLRYRVHSVTGCHLYALSGQGASHLRMVVAIQKRLLLFSWKHSVAWSTWCPSVDFEIVDGFNFVRVGIVHACFEVFYTIFRYLFLLQLHLVKIQGSWWCDRSIEDA